MERTYVMVKPDGVQRGLVGEIVSRLEKRGLKITAMRMHEMDLIEGEIHYAEHAEKTFFRDLVGFITSGPSVSMVVEGKDAVSVVRKMVGETDPKGASPGTIRGDFCLDIGRNVVHASDSKESAEREIKQHFSPNEIFSYKKIDEDWIYE
jgi:nucleoside-diphosphate kinase